MSVCGHRHGQASFPVSSLFSPQAKLSKAKQLLPVASFDSSGKD